MQVVILAAGKGKRMRPLSNAKPKPLIDIDGKSLLEHKLDMLPDEITEIVLVVGYRGSQLRRRIGNTYNGIPVTYVDQKENTGTGGALWVAKDRLKDRFIVMNGDDLYPKEDIKKCLDHKWSLLVQRADIHGATTFIGGNVILNDNGNLKDIKEGEHNAADALVVVGMYVLGKRMFDYELMPKAPGNEEFGLPQTLVSVAQDVPISIVETNNWVTATAPSDLEKAEAWLKENA